MIGKSDRRMRGDMLLRVRMGLKGFHSVLVFDNETRLR